VISLQSKTLIALYNVTRECPDFISVHIPAGVGYGHARRCCSIRASPALPPKHMATLQELLLTVLHKPAYCVRVCSLCFVVCVRVGACVCSFCFVVCVYACVYVCVCVCACVCSWVEKKEVCVHVCALARRTVTVVKKRLLERHTA
jgi:hypothetical protein